MIDATRIAQAIKEEIERQSKESNEMRPYLPYYDADALLDFQIDGEVDLVAVGHAILKLCAEDAALSLAVKQL